MLKLELHAGNIWLFLSLIFYSLLPDKNSGTFVQRFLISKNSKQLVKCMKIIAFLYLPFTIIICLIGLIIKVKAPNIDHNEALIYFISNYVSVVIKGLLVAGLLAVIISTADSWLNTTSVLFVHDIIGNMIHLTEKQALFIARTFTFLLCILAVELARRELGIMEVSWLVDNIKIRGLSLSKLFRCSEKIDCL